MNLTVHPEMNENAWSTATTTDARLKTLDSRRIFRGVAHGPLKGHPEIRVNFGCHREERSDVTIPNGIASISTFGIIEAMPLWIVTPASGRLTMTNQDFIYKGATGGTPVAPLSDPNLHEFGENGILASPFVD